MGTDIVLTAYFGNETKQLTLSQPCGAGGYHIEMDRYYHGQVVHTSEGWKAYINPKSELCYEDGLAMCEIAEEKNMNS